MSEDDLFGDYSDEEDVDDAFTSPTAFSGVSTSGTNTSESPASQPFRQLRSAAAGAGRPSAPPPPAQPAQQAFTCPKCSKTLLTPRGFKGHVDKCDKTPSVSVSSEQQPSTSSSTNAFTCPKCKKVLKTKKGFKGHVSKCQSNQVSTSSASSGSNVPTAVAASSSAANSTLPVTQDHAFRCNECHTVLQTRTGLMKHRALHRLQDANERKPQPSEFIENKLDETMATIIKEMLQEPNFGNDVKTKFLELLSSEKKTTPEYQDFIMTLTNFITELVHKQSPKILPMNQYEEALKRLNSYLSTNDSILKGKLQTICIQELGALNEGLAGRLVFKISSRLLDEVFTWSLKNMRSIRAEPQQNVQEGESEEEERGFLLCLSTLFIQFFQRSYTQSSKQSQAQADCLKDTFVEGPRPLSRRKFLNKNNWLSGDEECIIPSEHAVKFFKAVEKERRKNRGSLAQDIVEVFLGDNNGVLDHWYHLTQSYFSEDVSLSFMRNLIHCYIKKSNLLEEKRRNRVEDKEVRSSSVALRTHLHHNFVSKDNDDEVV